MPSIITDDDVRLNYLETGDPTGRPVVLIAGFKAPATSWRFQQKALVKAGYRVLALDRRGHGDSEAPEHGSTMQRHGADIADFLAALEVRDASLVGGSMGGNAIWSFVRQFGTDRVRDIVIVDQTPKMLNSEDWPYGFYDYTAATRDTAFATGIPDPGRVSAASKGPVRIARILRALDPGRGAGRPSFSPAELALLGDHARADWRVSIAATPVPILFVAGRESEFWPAEHAAAAAALNPLATSVVIEHDGHAANIEQPARFNAALLGFLRRS
ncbi:alpha/beta hydrolase [Rathayibacter sp. YIM 133350]|uniref:alpha/beta fold hydrolase n=1 Tax=Rathayibacter sp. YIM 133350 TaxID=3131992 RepID=UPI00307E20B9